MPPAIMVKNLGKTYRLDHLSDSNGYLTLRESITNVSRGLWDGLRGKSRRISHEKFQALTGVTFEVEPGQTVGIIGRNGAGKSTLLKILSRITEPSTGEISIRGRISSLLEVGTGFHPELTGRENIFLNGSILGMSRREIQSKFDEIVEFAEIERFLDTPVKRYSSGMYVRLAFAVAAHLEPEIMLIDEVLAVGDSAFQKKCLGKMDDVSRSGRTIIFVSHSMPTVQALCNQCLVMDQGQLIFSGPTHEAVQTYLALSMAESTSRRDLTNHSGRRHGSNSHMQEVTLYGGSDEPTSTLRMGEGLVISVAYCSGESPTRPVLGVVIKTRLGLAVLGVNNRFIPGFSFSDEHADGRITCRFAELPLMPGSYSIDLYFGNEHADLDVVLDACTFDVVATDIFGSGKLPPATAGPIFWPATWDLSNNHIHGSQHFKACEK